MKRPRVSIASVMIAVVIVAFSIAAGRACLALEHGNILLVGGALTAIAAQVGLVHLVRSRGSVRFFWMGFLACGLAALTSFGWATLAPGDEEIVYADGTREVVSSIGIEVFPDGHQERIYPSRNLEFWDRYKTAISSPLERLRSSPWGTTRVALVDATSLFLIVPLAYGLPQLAFATIGGLLIARLSRLRGGRSRMEKVDPTGEEGRRDVRSTLGERMGSLDIGGTASI